jgi:hypothetical protein
MKNEAVSLNCWLLTLLVVSLTYSAVCQGTFGNLDFESANVPFVPAGQFGANVPTSEGLPGWTADFGDTQIGTISHNNMTLGAPEVGIFGPAWFPSQILQGSYSVFLAQSTAGIPSTAAIGQAGTIPSTARSLTFFSSPAQNFVLTFSGQAIPLAQIGSGPNYIILGGDVSQFAGQSGELRFTAGSGILDNIQFSSSPIPEPTTGALYGLGGLLVGLRTHRKAPAKKRRPNGQRVIVSCRRTPTDVFFLGLGVFLTTFLAGAQGTFRNMDFGLSQVPNTTPWGTEVPVNQAFPFWSAYQGANQLTTVLYNGITAGGANVGLLTPADTADGGIPGHYAGVLQAGVGGGPGLVSAALAQTGQIPDGTMSLSFVATPPNGGGWQITVGGQSIPVVEISQVDSRFNEYGANISAFAGLTDELRFTMLPGTSSPGNMWLGEIQFSPIGVPEPATPALFAAGGAVLAFWVFRGKR